MGDDDIESEDEQYIINHSSDEQQHADSEEDESFNKNNEGKDDEIITTKKRKKSSKEDESQTEKKLKADATNDATTNVTTNAKTKPKGKAKNLLIETGREIHKFDTEVQATFLWTCVTHFLNKPPSSAKRNIHSKSFIPSINNKNNNNDHNMSSFLKQHYTSCKKLKNWKHNQTFKVIIVCISARRAVSILKDIAPLKISMAKLFPKHMSLSLQKDALEKNKYGIAVGTPNRLLKLWQEDALHLKKTDFIVIDCWKDAKDFTVCTLKDTSPDLMTFIESAALPEMEKREDLNFAFH